MRRPQLLLLTALLLTGSVAAAPSGTSSAATAGASIEEGTFPIGVCAWARPVSGDDKYCVIVNDPRPWLP